MVIISLMPSTYLRSASLNISEVKFLKLKHMIMMLRKFALHNERLNIGLGPVVQS